MLVVRAFLTALLLTASAPGWAIEEPPGELQPQTSVADLLSMLQAQQVQLDEQRQTIDSQRDMLERQREAISTQNDALRGLQSRVDQLAVGGGAGAPQELTEAEIALRARLETLEQKLAAGEERETTTDYDAENFPGAFAIPGTSAALRIGGFVKMNVIQSLDAVGAQNRFIVGTIPTGQIGSGDSEAELTVQQSRLNLELREDSDFGPLRAFVEGDFAGEGDTFRLRHAFGQFRDLMAGKTWSTFMDTEASPEEVDFEGINGRINVRQAQVRWFPSIAEDWNLLLALEDPTPDITGGDGVSQIPDLVASVQRRVRDRWNVKGALLLRTLRARWDLDPTKRDEATGWGISISGHRNVDWWDNPRDKLFVQMNFGKGYGRYINDLATVGGQDAVFDDTNGSLSVLPVWSSYVSLQKWWRDGLRSNFTLSAVRINTKGFQPDDAYDNTRRASANLIWSPTWRLDLGGELLWGRREDKDGSSGSAAQFQASARYRF
jgi:hypothetical protein